MKPIRHLLKIYPAWFFALFLVALAMKALIPDGYMISSDSEMITVQICNGTGESEQAISIPMDRDAADHDSGSNSTGNACSASSFSPSTMTVTDAVQLVGALAFIMLAALIVPIHLPPGRTARLRPPLRGPPAFT